MFKKITLVLCVVVIVSLFVVPSFAADVNEYTALTNGTAFLVLPYNNTWAIRTDYLPLDFAEHYQEPLLRFESIYPYELYGFDDGVEIFYDEALSAREERYYGFAIDKYETYDIGDVNYTILYFGIFEYDVNDGTITDQIRYGEDLGVTDGVIWTQIYVGDILDDPNNVTDFFAFMYPIIPLQWTDYSKVVNGSYNSGYVDGVIRGRAQVSQIRYDEGLSIGKTLGYQEGYDQGLLDGGGKNYFEQLVDAVIFAPVNAIVQMMNFDFFGVNVANIFLALITILILGGCIAFVARFMI